MIPQSPGAIAFSVGGWDVHWYGITMMCAFAVGAYVAIRNARRAGMNERQFVDMLFWVIIASFIGARMYHVWNEWHWYGMHVSDIWKIWNGGLALHGGLIAGFAVLVMYAKKMRRTLLELTDCTSIGVLVGQIIGRIGNYFNEELFGQPTQAPWALRISPAARPEQYRAEAGFHPLFLYEMLLNSILLFVLFVLRKRVRFGSGVLTASYLMGYGAIRFGLDFLRIDEFGFGPFTFAQYVSLTLIIVGGALLALSFRKKASLSSADSGKNNRSN
jgi:phosphatidylglycerol:prolipoprotein diacylglycerol transferase